MCGVHAISTSPRDNRFASNTNSVTACHLSLLVTLTALVLGTFVPILAEVHSREIDLIPVDEHAVGPFDSTCKVLSATSRHVHQCFSKYFRVGLRSAIGCRIFAIVVANEDHGSPSYGVVRRARCNVDFEMSARGAGSAWKDPTVGAVHLFLRSCTAASVSA